MQAPSLSSFYLCILLGILTGCSGPSSSIPIDLDKSNPERLLAFYLGSYVTPEAGDPFEAGLLSRDGDEIRVDLDRLNRLNLSVLLEDSNGSGAIEWDEMAPFLNATYYEVRSFPASLPELQSTLSFDRSDSTWMELVVDGGAMTTARRRLFMNTAALKDALASYEEHGRSILYPTGTAVIGEHYEGDRHVETTVMKKRGDGFWDFIVYDEAGRLADATQTGREPLVVPTRCVGCHFGRKRFQPEASFPAPAPPGPFGPRGLLVDDVLRDSTVTALLDEHERRSDYLLGLYGTVYVSGLRHRHARGAPLSEEERAILEELFY